MKKKQKQKLQHIVLQMVIKETIKIVKIAVKISRKMKIKNEANQIHLSQLNYLKLSLFRMYHVCGRVWHNYVTVFGESSVS